MTVLAVDREREMARAWEEGELACLSLPVMNEEQPVCDPINQQPRKSFNFTEEVEK